MKNMANCNFLVSILGMMIGAGIMNAASEFPLEFTENGPGAGFWPFALGAAMPGAYRSFYGFAQGV